MLKLSQLLDAKQRNSSDTYADISPLSRQSPQSPLTADLSTPVSPVVSLFSSKGHTRVSSSVSSLVSSPGQGNSMESSRNALTGVKEEPCQARDLEEEYFRMSLPSHLIFALLCILITSLQNILTKACLLWTTRTFDLRSITLNLMI